MFEHVAIMRWVAVVLWASLSINGWTFYCDNWRLAWRITGILQMVSGAICFLSALFEPAVR